MGKIEEFEDLLVWQKAMDFCDEIFTLMNETRPATDFGLKDQMNRASISIPSNIAEGFERDSNRQFAFFLKIAKGSAGEIRTQLHLARRRNYIDEPTFERLKHLVKEISKMSGSLISYLRKNGENYVSEPEITYGNIKEQSKIQIPNFLNS